MTRLLPAAALTALLCLLLFAAMPLPAPAAQAGGYCQQHPEACAAAAERLKARCAADPAACERMHERAEDLKARCAADPAACEARRQALRDSAQQARERCAADPEACEQRRQQLREQLKDRRKQTAPVGETPPTLPPKPEG